MTDQPAHKHPRLFSPTALRIFSACPKQYESAYLLKPEVYEEPSAQLVIGNVVHRTLVLLYRMPVQQRGGEVAERALRHFWSQAERAGAFSCDEEEAACGKLAIDWLQLYCQEYDLSVQPLMLEQWATARLDSGQMLGGLVDRVDRAPDGIGLEVIDYKTGRFATSTCPKTWPPGSTPWRSTRPPVAR